MSCRFAVLAWVVLAVWALAVPRGFAQGALTAIFTNGPTSNRINLVILSEGYQTNQLGQFLMDATNAANNLLSVPPYQEYRSYFNAYAISVASQDSGADHYTPTTNLVNTYFNSAYDNYGRPDVLTIPPNDHDSSYAHGQGKVDTLLQSLMPEYDLPMLLVNDTNYGGSGGATLISSLHSSAPNIVRHESGHTFAALGDEYDNPYPGYPETEEPNTTTQTNRSLIKWLPWIDPDTPVPTPETGDYVTVVGLFEGAHYHPTNWYRPKFDCKMKTLIRAFCEVCSEQIVKSAYQRLRSIGAFAPVSTNVSVTTTQSVAFSVTPLQPMTHSLSVQWFTNSIAVTGATNPTYNLFPNSFTNGTHTLRAEVRDSTALVRNDPANVLSNSISWTLNVSLSELSLISPQWLAGGRFSFCVTGVAPQGFVIQASTNLSNWIPLSTSILAGGTFYFTNSSLTNFPRRFYRTLVTP